MCMQNGLKDAFVLASKHFEKQSWTYFEPGMEQARKIR